MAISDRWHASHPKPDGEAWLAEHPLCREHSRGRTKLYETRDHGKGDRWQVRFRDDAGRQVKRNFPKHDGSDPNTCAEAFDAQVRSELNRGVYVDPAAGKVKFRDVAEDWLKGLGHVDESTREAIESRLKNHVYPVLGHHEMRVLSKRPSIVQKWLSGLQLEASYVKVILGHVSAIFVAAIDDGVVVRNPTKAGSVKPPKVVKQKIVPWPAERVHALGEALPARFEAMVTAGAGAGMRQGEIFGLAVDDIEFLGGQVIHVRRQIKIVRGKLVFAPPKGGKLRDVPLAESIGLVLSAHIAAHPPVEVTLPWKVPDGKPHTARLMFTSANGLPLSRNDYNRHVWKPALVKAKIVKAPKRGEALGPLREYGMHQLRHFYASSLLADGVDIRTLAEYLGHGDPGFTLRTYTHLMPSAPDRARKAVDAVFSGGQSALNVPRVVTSAE
jgi:integrase